MAKCDACYHTTELADLQVCQYQKYPPPPNLKSHQFVGFPPPASHSHITLLLILSSLHTLVLLNFVPPSFFLLLAPSVGLLCLTFLCLNFVFLPHSLQQSAGHVQSTAFSVCSGLSQMPLTVLSIESTIETFLSTIPSNRHVVSLDIW